MELIAVSVGQPRTVSWHDKPVETGIFKAPVDGPVMARTLNLEGDRQADLSVHGGADKAVYAYPMEHYAFWQAELPELAFPWGAFGENLTTRGLSEDELRIGDRLRIGQAEFVVTQPRVPCYKLGVRFGRPDMTKRFLVSRRSGFYLAVEREGLVAAGDPIELLARDEQAASVADLFRLYAFDKDDRATMRRALNSPGLAEGWRDFLAGRLAELEAQA